MKYCRFCGAPVGQDTKFCPKCGKTLIENTGESPGKETAGKGRIRILIIVLVISAAVVSLLCFFLLFGKSSPKEGKKLVDHQDQFEQLYLEDTEEPINLAFREKVSYEITDTKWEEDIGTAEVAVYTPDLSAIIQQGISDALEKIGSEDYQAALEHAKQNIQKTLESDQCPMTETTVQMQAKKDGDDIILVSNEDFEKAITGDLEKLYFDALTEGVADEKDN